MSIGKRLKQWQDSRELIQTDAAVLLGAKKRTYQDYLADITSPSARVITSLIEQDVNPVWLLTGNGPMLISDSGLGNDAPSHLERSTDGFFLGKWTPYSHMSQASHELKALENELNFKPGPYTHEALKSLLLLDEERAFRGIAKAAIIELKDQLTKKDIRPKNNEAIDYSRLHSAVYFVADALDDYDTNLPFDKLADAVVATYKIFSSGDKINDATSRAYAYQTITSLIESAPKQAPK